MDNMETPNPVPTPIVGECDTLAGHTWEDLQLYRMNYETQQG